MALTAKQTAQLIKLQGRATAYEIVAIHPNGALARVCYCGRHSGHGLRRAVNENAQEIVSFFDAGQDARAMPEGKMAVKVDGGGIVKYSGRTQRDAIQAGELVWVGSPSVALLKVQADLASEHASQREAA